MKLRLLLMGSSFRPWAQSPLLRSPHYSFLEYFNSLTSGNPARREGSQDTPGNFELIVWMGCANSYTNGGRYDCWGW